MKARRGKEKHRIAKSLKILWGDEARVNLKRFIEKGAWGFHLRQSLTVKSRRGLLQTFRRREKNFTLELNAAVSWVGGQGPL